MLVWMRLLVFVHWMPLSFTSNTYSMYNDRVEFIVHSIQSPLYGQREDLINFNNWKKWDKKMQRITKQILH